MRETSEDRRQLKGHIVALYTTVLQFMLKVKLFFEASAASKCPLESHLGACPKQRRSIFCKMNAADLALRQSRLMCISAFNIPHMLRFIGSSERVISSVYKSTDGIIHLLEVAAQHASQVATVSGRIDSEHQFVTQALVDDLSDSHQRSMIWLRERLEEDKNIMIDIVQSNHLQIMNSLYRQNARLDHIDDAISHFVDPNKSRQAHTRSLFRSSVTRLLAVQRAVAAFQGGYKVYDRLKILRWLSVIPYQQHQSQAYSEVQQGTGTWFLQDVVYKSWKQTPESSLLWLHGPPGCGKSKLM